MHGISEALSPTLYVLLGEGLDDLMSRLDRDDKIRQITPNSALGGAP